MNTTNPKIVVAKLTRCVLPRGGFSAINMQTGDAGERICTHEGGFVMFCVEGESDFEVIELEEYERLAMQRMHDDVLAEHGIEIKPTHKLRFNKQVALITGEGWEMYPSFTYYAEGTVVAETPERGISLDMAEIMYQRNNIAYEAAEIDDAARKVNIHLSMHVLEDAANNVHSRQSLSGELVAESDQTPPSGSSVH